ncbi:MAG: P1 family peptidase [Oscillospiraceae bacterium]|jgi:L-aminopeptidase/D-esterase-like protein|nr:P1 family peptidase [Oscillospiraceae bacterium]
MQAVDIQALRAFRLGQEQDLESATGCTVVLCPKGALCGADVRGGSPGTRDTDALSPLCNRRAVHAVVLAGGSSFGLDAAGGVMRFCEEQGIGRDVGVAKVPNVCAAILFDLKCGRSDVRPDAEMGYRACQNAMLKQKFQRGNFGAGTGAAVGKARGMAHAMKGGIGCVALRHGDLIVGAVVAVNCVGDVVSDGKIIAGTRDGQNGFADSEEVLLSEYQENKDFFSGNTVLGCLITNAVLDKPGAVKLASQGQNGIARVVRPAHSTFDGDTVFALCSGEVCSSQDAVGILSAKAMELAILDAVQCADGLHGLPGLRDLRLRASGAL